MGTEFEFSAAQFAAITAPLEPGVVIAGAGSGKTAVMAARVVWLVATGQVEPEQVLGLTFTTKAAGELGTRIRSALTRAGFTLGGPPPSEGGDQAQLGPTVATYNAYSAALLTEHGLRIGHEPDIRVIAGASRYQLAGRALTRHRAHVEVLTDHLKTAIGYVLAMDEQLSEHLATPDDVRTWQSRERPRWAAAAGGPRGGRAGINAVLRAMDGREELLGLVEGYRELKTELGLMDFSDQVELAARLAVKRPEVGALEREKFHVVLLDEYQDTSVAQALMLSGLFSGGTVSDGRGHPVTAVGDPNQAIYGWRGASMSNILNFGRDFPAADASVGDDASRASSLTVNRRSDIAIVDVANELARPLHALSPDLAPLQPRAAAAQGVVRVAVLETYDAELGFLVDGVCATHAKMREPTWSRIGVLTRDNDHSADVYDALTAARVPVEIVGLKGLLRLPEVSEVLATLELMHDLTANAALLRLLVGPRWAVGARDLALLGRRAAHLVRPPGSGGRTESSMEEALASAVVGTDTADLISLSDALDDPGSAGYSPQALERFALLSEELRGLRGHAGEPLLDLVRRIIDTSGIDLELAASLNPTSQSRRDNLDLFVKAVADFAAVDGDVSLAALLAYLSAEDEFGNGLDAATPTESDSVKLLTVHRAKGLEWDAVFVPGVCESRFPSTIGRSQWLKAPSVLPIPLRGDRESLPSLDGYTETSVASFPERARDHEQREELRLGYVAVTRARHLLVMSAHCWRPGRRSPLGASPFLHSARKVVESRGGPALPWVDTPDKQAVNPVFADTSRHPWPVEPRGDEVRLRREAAARVQDHLSLGPEAGGAGEDQLDRLGRAQVAEWDQQLERLLEEGRRNRADVVDVPLPSSLSAIALARLAHDPQGFAATLARPMPRRPVPEARFGTRFHAWVEARLGQQQILDPEDLSGRGDAEIDDESDLQDLIERFEAGPFSDRTPLGVEQCFALVLAGQVVRGRIDAVYETDRGFLVVDWKTNRAQDADPLQLAIYRLAWAELRGVPLADVEAGFYYVRTGELVRPAALLDRAGLERLVTAPMLVEPT